MPTRPKCRCGHSAADHDEPGGTACFAYLGDAQDGGPVYCACQSYGEALSAKDLLPGESTAFRSDAKP